VLPLVADGRIFKPVVAVEGNFGGAGDIGWGSGCGDGGWLLPGAGRGAPVGFFIVSLIVDDGTASAAGLEGATVCREAVSVGSP
jgi:hypothetical protein